MEPTGLEAARTFLALWLTMVNIVSTQTLFEKFQIAMPGWDFAIWPASEEPLSNGDMIVMFSTDDGARFFFYYEASEDNAFWSIGSYNIASLSIVIPVYHLEEDQL